MLASAVATLAGSLRDDAEFPPLGGPKSLEARRHALQELTERASKKDAARLGVMSLGRLPATGFTPREIREDPWIGEVLKESKGTLPTRETYVSMPARAVLAAYAAAGIGRKEAERSPEYAEALAAAVTSGGDQWDWLRSMKKRSGAYRARWINSDGTAKDAQLSFIGRALPPAPAEARRAALAQHRVDLTSTFQTDPSLLGRARTFAKRWASRRVIRAKAPLGEPCWPSQSSCLERGAGKGGLLRHMLATCAFDDVPGDLRQDQLGAVAGLDGRFVAHALREMAKGGIPTHRVTCLSERGVKTRVVTVGQAWAQVLGHTVRKRLLRGLKCTPETAPPLVGMGPEEMVRHLVGGHGETLVSTDLTRASDLLPFDLLSAIIDGLEASGKLSELEVEILRILSGPQRLLYGSEEVTSSRGALMGLPTTWVLLSLVHLFWVDEVSRTSPPGDERRAHKAELCGDDALLATTARGAARYKAIVRESGGSASEGKHFESRGTTLLRGVFLEKLFEFRVRKGRILEGRHFGAMPVKGLTSTSLPREFVGGTPVRCTSRGITQIMTLDLLADCPALDAPIRNYIRIAAPWLPAFAEKALRLAPGHPLHLGGFRWAKRTPEGDLLAKACRDSGRSFTLSVRREADPDWRMALGWSEQGRKLAKAEGELVDLGHYAPLPSDVAGPLLRSQVRLPEGEYDVYDERERVLATVSGMYAQVKCFSERRAEVYRIRSKDLIRALQRQRREGAEHPVAIPLDELSRVRKRIAWRVPDSETAERGVSWTADTKLPRREVLAAVCTVLGPAALRAARLTRSTVAGSSPTVPPA